MWHTYILLCDQKTFYVGISDNPEERLRDHHAGKSLHTKKFSDLQFVYCESYPGKQQASVAEGILPGSTGVKKLAQIAHNPTRSFRVRGDFSAPIFIPIAVGNSSAWQHSRLTV